MPSRSTNQPTLYVGLMSGTSLDGVDGVLVDFANGDDQLPLVLGHAFDTFDAPLRAELLALNASGADELQRMFLAGNALARSYTALVRRLLAEAGVGAEAVKAIGAHGQTVRHRPGEFDGIGYTVQLNNPSLLAELSGIDVIADFRSRDVAAGGQGAPLAPGFHKAVFGRSGQSVAVLNLGGIANLTLVDADGTTRGFDCGPANALIDHWTLTHLGRPFDRDGQWAASGRLDQLLLDSLMSEPFLSAPPPKSTGRDLFNPVWFQGHLDAASAGRSLHAQAVQATLVEFTARSATDALLTHFPAVRELLVCGGGAYNTHLMGRIAARLPGVKVERTDDRGLPATQVEGCAFAWLAKAFVERQPGNIASVTGAKGARVLGALYPS